MFFTVSQVEVHPLLPPLVAFGISFFTSMGGVSGAFLLLPFQVSVLGFTSPSVSATNLVYNIGAIPPGVHRLSREGRMFWPLAWIITAGTIPGLALGVAIRVIWLPDPRLFKLFAGGVLLAIGWRMAAGLTAEAKRRHKPPPRRMSHRSAGGAAGKTVVKRLRGTGALHMMFRFGDDVHGFSMPGVLAFSAMTGVLGGAYGIGGGSIMAPILVSVFGLPVHAVAGPALFGTCLTSVFGVLAYSVAGRLAPAAGLSTAPDWTLGLLFAAGGAAGIYLGARVQKYVPALPIKLTLLLTLIGVALRYIFAFFA